MKSILLSLSFLLVLALSAQTYTNPVLVPGIFKNANNKDVSVNSIADPGVFRDTDGTYYLYVTGKGYPCFSSKDLVNWKYETNVFRANDAKWATRSFWAPEVMKIGEKYYLHYTAAREDDIKHIGIAVSDSPTGPFADISDTPFIDHGEKGTIDSHIFVDDDGRTYMYYSNAMSTNPISELGGKKRSEIWVVEVASDLSSQISEHKMLIYPSQNWEFNQGSNNYWNEGAVVLKQNGIYYLFYSANCYCNPNYSVGYATSDSPMGPFTKSSLNPILSNAGVGQHVSGPGHHSIVRSPDDSEWFFVYHSHVYVGQLSSSNDGIRQVSIDRMYFPSAGSVYVQGPTYTAQPFPSYHTGLHSASYQNLTLYPTLVDDKFFLKQEIKGNEPTLFVTSVLGQEMQMPISSNSTVDLSELSPGVYYVTLLDSGISYKTKIIKR